MGCSLGIGKNTRAMVMTRAVREMSKLGEAAGGHRDTFAGLAGMGDLIVTCTVSAVATGMSASSSARASRSTRSSHR
jgi:glycerol-3-phosphate dehydrogenase